MRKPRLAVVSPFIDKCHGTERRVAEWISRLDEDFEIHVYSQRVEDVNLEKICEMGPWDVRDPVQDDFLEIDIFQGLAIHVVLEIRGQSRDPFRDAAFGAMTLVNEG